MANSCRRAREVHKRVLPSRELFFPENFTCIGTIGTTDCALVILLLLIKMCNTRLQCKFYPVHIFMLIATKRQKSKRLLAVLRDMYIPVGLQPAHHTGQPVQRCDELLRAGQQRVHDDDLPVAGDAARALLLSLVSVNTVCVELPLQ